MYIKSPINSYNNLNIYKKYLNDIDGFITGGCFKNSFNNEPIKDIDIFFHNQKDFDDAVEMYEDDYCFKHKYENDNCIAFFDKKNNIDIELIRSIFGTPEEIMNSFDFTIVKACLVKNKTQQTPDTDLLLETPPNISSDINDFEFEFIYHPKFFEHLICKKLVIDDRIPKSVATFNRVLKYTKYGYGLCRESKTKLITEIIRNGNVEDINNDLYFGWD